MRTQRKSAMNMTVWDDVSWYLRESVMKIWLSVLELAYDFWDVENKVSRLLCRE